MLAKRIIPCLDVKEGRVVKGTKFVNLKDAGDPVEQAIYYDQQGADELCFLDITASHEKRYIMINVVRKVADKINIPFTVGGGINDPEHIREILTAGADKVSINTAAVNDPDLIKIASDNGAKWVGNPDTQDIVAEIKKLEPAGIDVVLECAGQQETIDQAVEVLRPGGRLVLVGIPREPRISFSIDKLRRKEITVINTRRQNECTQKAVDLISSGQANLDFMITHNFTTAQATEGFELVAGYKDGVVKAFINF